MVTMVASVTRDLARLTLEARLSPPPSGSGSSFSRFLWLGLAALAVVREGEGWRWSRVSHLITKLSHRDHSLPSLPQQHLRHGQSIELQGTDTEVLRKQLVCLCREILRK